MLFTLDCLISHIVSVCKCVCFRGTVLARPSIPLFIVWRDTTTARQTDGQGDDRRTETERQRVAHAAFIVLLRISLIVFVSFALILGE